MNTSVRVYAIHAIDVPSTCSRARNVQMCVRGYDSCDVIFVDGHCEYSGHAMLGLN